MKNSKQQELNQRLKNAIEAVINQQIAENDPPQTIETIERLQTEGFTQQEAFTLIGHLISLEVAEELIGESGLNMERYITALEKLPAPFAKSRKQDDEEE